MRDGRTDIVARGGRRCLSTALAERDRRKSRILRHWFEPLNPECIRGADGRECDTEVECGIFLRCSGARGEHAREHGDDSAVASCGNGREEDYDQWMDGNGGRRSGQRVKRRGPGVEAVALEETRRWSIRLCRTIRRRVVV